ncbi:thyroid adenoma-associated protein homolog [Copidosoma floridanum]|uniref:thyroid adenoma-associated protein homolog n=1 Tax=Copidosoma floridanum TaxID=29053 RepID=UPI0006C9D4CA|nr:thyroid adenoma-associated protein homolog [Copidosoma floridanum]
MDEIKRENDSDFINLLKELKKEGELDSKECLEQQVFKWRNTIEYEYLENWLTSDNEEWRLGALSLLAISKKSTLGFTEQELELIITFLTCNIRDRIEYVPLIKKVLKRLNDSYMVMNRQLEREMKKLESEHSVVHTDPHAKSNISANILSYKSFVTTLHAVCVRNLYPGAVNVRKKSSLQILCLINEFLCQDLTDTLYSLDDYKVLLDCVLLDTYENNKELAYFLIESTKLTDTFFDTQEKLSELIEVAVQLADNVRPLDCIAAAYMLRISMLSSRVEEVLIKMTKFKPSDCLKKKTVFQMMKLLTLNLKGPFQLVRKSIVMATSKHSLYGYVFCIHNILTTIDLNTVDDYSWRNLMTDIVNICFILIEGVSEIVNNSSPEGHLPMDLDSRHLNCITKDDDNVVVTAQRVLLCSWRTVKEISLFFGFLAGHAPIKTEELTTGLLHEYHMIQIGNELFTLLCETKHRGAFEQAHVGFQQLCNRLWHLDVESSDLQNLPKFWLRQILLAVVGLTTENSKLCATRRSAGVPFMVQALVTSEIKKHGNAKNYIFHPVMNILLKLAFLNDDFNVAEVKTILSSEILLFTDEYLEKTTKECTQLNEITEIKSHALNILRALFRHCLLGDLVKDYIADGFIVAFKSYDGKTWAERNAATLLFSSLMVRVFGVQRTKDHVNLSVFNQMSGKTFFGRYPALSEFIFYELKAFVNSPEDEIKPKIQCMLLILSRLMPSSYSWNYSKGDKSSWQMDNFIDLVSKCSKSRVWKTRELAARALVPLIMNHNIHAKCCNIIQLMTSNNLPHNLLHGYTLQFLQFAKSPVFEKIPFSTEEIQKLINFTVILLDNLENSEKACFPASTAVLEIFIELSKMNPYSYICRGSNYLNLHVKIQAHLMDNNVLKRKPGIELYEVAAINLLLTENYFGSLINNEYFSPQFFDYLLKHRNEEVLSISWSKLIYVILKTNNAMLYDLGFLKAVKALDKPADDPDLQESIHDFLYRALQEMERGNECTECTFSKDDEKVYMCMHIFTKMSQAMKAKDFHPRGNFLKLFARTFGYLLRTRKDTELTMAAKKVMYDAISTYSTMESNIDCRIGISEVMPLLYIGINDKTKKNDIYLILQWWTTLLQLLYDDSAEVRSNAILIISNLMPETKTYCETIVTDTFFMKFASALTEVVEAVAAACFCWSMKSAAIVLEEIDEADVFNKSYNYECFEPLHIARNCCLHLRCGVLKHNVNSLTLPKPLKEWLQMELHLNESLEFETLDELIDKYKVMVPECEKTLKRVLDPAYPAKLINEIVYEEMKKCCDTEGRLNIE